MNDAESSYGVEALNSRLFRRTPHGLEVLNREKAIYSDFDAVFRDASTFTAVMSRNFARGSLTGASVVYFEVSAAECFFIDSEQDLKIAAMLASQHG
jgi:CMP-N-acetylneuraminic acid synthetase